MSGFNWLRSLLKRSARRTGGETASQYLAQMAKDPDWVKRRKERADALRAKQEMFAQIERPILDDLAAAGMPALTSVYDLLQRPEEDYGPVIPVLIHHLRNDYHTRVREGLVRALTVKGARGTAGPEIIRQLERQGVDDVHTRDAMATALRVVATRGDAERIEMLMIDPRNEELNPELGRALRRVLRERKLA